ncbi:hypothetical protein [Pseudomonas aeruginosa]|uniref:hypothetical protein n=1 Tax=Pseudomonas aeruginosa TaxID=287 RepID=UPI001043889C|nr:hypothetical protein [Pseudomonas aeruginosa]
MHMIHESSALRPPAILTNYGKWKMALGDDDCDGARANLELLKKEFPDAHGGSPLSNGSQGYVPGDPRLEAQGVGVVASFGGEIGILIFRHLTGRDKSAEAGRAALEGVKAEFPEAIYAVHSVEANVVQLIAFVPCISPAPWVIASVYKAIGLDGNLALLEKAIADAAARKAPSGSTKGPAAEASVLDLRMLSSVRPSGLAGIDFCY